MSDWPTVRWCSSIVADLDGLGPIPTRVLGDWIDDGLKELEVFLAKHQKFFLYLKERESE